jgi:hypothetical protein
MVAGFSSLALLKESLSVVAAAASVFGVPVP